jgi:hypothetical protein
MVEQILPNNNESATEIFPQKICHLNTPLVGKVNSPNIVSKQESLRTKAPAEPLPGPDSLAKRKEKISLYCRDIPVRFTEKS